MELSSENMNKKAPARSFVCNICDTSFISLNGLHNHKILCHIAAPDNSDSTQMIEIRLPVGSLITGRYVAKFKIGKEFNGIDTPDGCNVVHIESEDDFVRLTNPNDIDYAFLLTTFYRGKEVHLARAKYDSAEQCLQIDNHWIISNRSIENRFSRAVTTERVEPKDLLKIELNEKHFQGLDLNVILSNLVSIRFNNGPYCKIGFNRNKLAFVSYEE